MSEEVRIEELCLRLTKIGRNDKANRLLEMYHINPKDKNYLSDDDLDLNSVKDFVTFLELIKTDWELLFGMNELGQISADWDNLTNGDFLHIKFFGNDQVYGLTYINEFSNTYEMSMLDFKNKLLELNIIKG